MYIWGWENTHLFKGEACVLHETNSTFVLHVMQFKHPLITVRLQKLTFLSLVFWISAVCITCLRPEWCYSVHPLGWKDFIWFVSSNSWSLMQESSLEWGIHGCEWLINAALQKASPSSSHACSRIMQPDLIALYSVLCHCVAEQLRLLWGRADRQDCGVTRPWHF